MLCMQDQKLCSRIVRVIIGGNSITHKPAKTEDDKEKKKVRTVIRDRSNGLNMLT